MTTDEQTEAYADALLAIAKAEGNGSETEDELFRFARILEGSDELREKLADVHLPVSLRLQIVNDLLGDKATAATVNLVSMVVGLGHVRDLPAMVDAMVASSARQSDKEVAEVRSAIPLTDDQKSRLAVELGKATGKQVEVKVIIDHSIKGGLIARVGDTVIDGSVRRRLEQLRNSF